MKETNIQNAIRIAAVKHGCFLLRNNVGVLQDRNGQYIRYGLSTGSSDLIGWTIREMEGLKVAIFTAIEVKKPGKKPTKEQDAFLQAVRHAGGIAILAHSVEEFEEGMR